LPNGKKKTFYFGPLTDPDAAPERFNREWPFLKQGRTPPPVDTGDGCRLLKLCKAFLTAKNAQLDGGELSGRTFGGYHQTAQRMLVHFGRERRVDDLRPDDFEDFPKALSKSLGLAALRNEINRVRIILKYAFDNRLIDRPVAYGQGFDKPSARMLRKAKHEAGANLFEADEVRRILDATDPVVRAMTYLAINTGCGNTEIAGRTGIGPPCGGSTQPSPARNDTIQPAAAKTACHQDGPDPPFGCNRWLGAIASPDHFGGSTT
jgi:hypothetical protein